MKVTIEGSPEDIKKVLEAIDGSNKYFDKKEIYKQGTRQPT